MAKQNSQEKTAQVVNSEQLDNLIETVSNVSDHAVETSRRAVDKSVKIVKEYPIHTAIGAGVLGFLAGVVTNKIFKR